MESFIEALKSLGLLTSLEEFDTFGNTFKSPLSILGLAQFISTILILYRNTGNREIIKFQLGNENE